MSFLRGARIYYLHPLLAGPVAQWGPHLDCCAALGFDHVLIAPPFATGRSRSLLLAADHARIHPALGWTGSAEEFLVSISQQCKLRGLALLLDLPADRVAAEGALAFENPRWFMLDDERALALDPRRSVSDLDATQFRFDVPERSQQITAWWIARLQSWLGAGVSGFRCLGLRNTPAEFWTQLISASRDQYPTSRFIAWNADLSWQQSAALANCGFDSFTSSACWWDYRADWFADEYERLGLQAPLLSFAESPFDQRLGTALAPGLREIAARRALWFTGTIASNWLLPMGCEFGALTPLDPRSAGPKDFDALSRQPVCDFSADIRAINAHVANAETNESSTLRQLSSPMASVAGFLRADSADPRRADESVLILVNADLSARSSIDPNSLLPQAGGRLNRLELICGSQPGGDALQALAPGETRVLLAHAEAPVLSATSALAETTAMQAPRIAIERVSPDVDGGRFAVRRVAGEAVEVSADIFIDGHDQIAAALLWRAIDESDWQEVPMRDLGNDHWAGDFPLARIGRHEFTVLAWFDAFGSFQYGLAKKHEAGVDTTLEIEEGRLLLLQIAEQGEGDTAPVAAVAKQLGKSTPAQRLEMLLSEPTAKLAEAARYRPHLVRHEPALPVEAERIAARYASWYELFPRSQTDDPARHGGFADVIARLPAIRDMGFDVLYFPPIHPIGKTHRKGRNNTLTAGEDDPGSPYAIGAADGGHDAIHAQLGTFEDFRRLRQAAAEHGLELALDFAIQCSPDHPWLKAHPGWFAWRPDGSMRYAENPPKKYQDIVNVDFYAEDAVPDLWLALRDVVLGWVAEGVKIFRVDNPHTKPLPFWEWLIADVRGRDPEVIFLAEAFTRPTMMNRLGKLGFSQSYTYFTWRNTKQELAEYFTQLNSAPVNEYYRPHFFVNTPDINPLFLQTSGRAGFMIRAALATMGSGLWGMYSGFELCESAALPGKEEYLDSEKFEIRVRDWQAPGNIIDVITQLNRIRRHNPALQTHLGLRLYKADNDRILYFGKSTPDLRNFILVAVSLDPYQAQEATFELPLWELGLPDDAALQGEDLMNGHRWTWQGKTQFMRIEPWNQPFGIWRISK